MCDIYSDSSKPETRLMSCCSSAKPGVLSATEKTFYGSDMCSDKKAHTCSANDWLKANNAKFGHVGSTGVLMQFDSF